MGGKLDRAFLEELGRYRLPESELGKCLLKYRGAGLVVKKQNAELEAINVKTREAQQKLEGLAALIDLQIEAVNPKRDGNAMGLLPDASETAELTSNDQTEERTEVQQ